MEPVWEVNTYSISIVGVHIRNIVIERILNRIPIRFSTSDCQRYTPLALPRKLLFRTRDHSSWPTWVCAPKLQLIIIALRCIINTEQEFMATQCLWMHKDIQLTDRAWEFISGWIQSNSCKVQMHFTRNYTRPHIQSFRAKTNGYPNIFEWNSKLTRGWRRYLYVWTNWIAKSSLPIPLNELWGDNCKRRIF